MTLRIFTEKKTLVLAYEEFPKRRKIPKCCRECRYLGGETSDWDGAWVTYCDLGIWLPIRKGTCKRQVPQTYVGSTP